MLCPTSFLSVCEPMGSTVYIPLAELASRQHELPPPPRAVKVVNACVEAYGALGWLHARGRRAHLVEPDTVPPPTPGARYRLWEPNAFLQEILEQHALPKPAPLVLDLGCGSGREAVYLADRGCRVMAVDRLPDALERGRQLQVRYAPESPPIEWICVDLEQSVWQPPEPPEVVCLFFFFSRELLRRAWEWLAPGGWLILEAFTETHFQTYGRPASPERRVSSGERLLPAKCVRYRSEGWRESERHTLRLWAIK